MPLFYDSGTAQPTLHHPLYARNEWYWRFYWIAYRGGRDYLEPQIRYSPISRTYIAGNIGSELSRDYTMLQAFSREDNADWLRRLERARYDNHCQTTVRQVVAHVLDAAEVVREPAATLADYLTDVDLAGQDRTAWMRWGMTLAQVFGHAFALTEIPALPGGVEIATAADAAALGQRPYSAWFSPLDVPNWSIDDRGELDWIILRYPHRETPRLPLRSEPKALVRYRVWTRETWQDWLGTDEQDQASASAQLTKVGEGANPIGRVPVDVLYNLRDASTREPIGVSRLTDVAFLNRDLYNLTSMVTQQLYEQTFAWLAIPGGHKLKKLALGLSRFFGFDTQAGSGMPAYVSPPEGPTRLLMDQIERTEQRIRTIAGMGRGVAEQSIAARPAESLAFESGDKAAELRQVRGEAESFEERNLRTVAAWAGWPVSAVGAIDVRYGEPQVSAPAPAPAPAPGNGTPRAVREAAPES